MKKTLLSFVLLATGFAGYSQDAPKVDTTKNWTIHG